MKTRNNITRTATQYAIGAALAFASFVPVNAYGLTKSEMANIDRRFDYLNRSIEKSLKYEAPGINAVEEAVAYDASLAMARLDNFTANMEASLRFEAPAADVMAEANDAEVAAAAERLEKMNLVVEESIRFSTAAFGEVENCNFTCDNNLCSL